MRAWNQSATESVRIGCGATAVSAADYYTYLNSGQFTGMLAGMRGAAEYEQLLDDKLAAAGSPLTLRRKATEAMSSQTAAHIAIILFIILVIFGAGKLPEIGGALGKGIKNFKKATREPDEIDITPSSVNGM
jgi:sec-independent protein translocase protein TatA